MKTSRFFGAFVCACWAQREIWWRLPSGLGLSIMWCGPDFRPLFSERNGFRTAYYIWRLRIEVLR